MSLTLGEKLRQAREERGISLSEVSEQTRISSLYLESIENDDYRILPGGIFNKGFVKSYAKYVGVDEQEALLDYSRILAENEGGQDEDLKIYKPEVLTDDRSSSIMPTVIWAVVILSLMTAGIWFGVDYYRNRPDTPIVNTPPANVNSNATSPAHSSETNGSVPDMATLKVEFKAVSQPVRLSATSDNIKSDDIVASGSTKMFEPKESLTLNYNRWNAKAVQLTINGKSITLPAEPLDHKGQRIEFTISKDNLAQIWTNGAISTEVSTVNPDANANVATTTTPVITRPTPAPKPSVAANTAPIQTPAANAARPTPKPSATRP